MPPQPLRLEVAGFTDVDNWRCILIEYPCAGRAIGIASLHCDLDFDRAVGVQQKTSSRQVYLVRLWGDRGAEERDQCYQQNGDHDGLSASCSKVARCCAALSATTTNASLCWIRT